MAKKSNSSTLFLAIIIVLVGIAGYYVFVRLNFFQIYSNPNMDNYPNKSLGYVPTVAQEIREMKDTNWLFWSYNHAYEPIVGCEDATDSSKINPNDIEASFRMESNGPDGNMLFTSESEAQSRTKIIEDILKKDGWVKCNNVTKQSSDADKVKIIDNTVIFNKEKEFVSISNSFIKWSYRAGVPATVPESYEIYLTFYKYK